MAADPNRREVPPAPIYRSLIRPMLLLGGERELMMVTALMACFLVLVIKSLASIIVGTALWVIAAAGLARLAKSDAQMSKVYLRHLRYQKFYPGRASRWGHIRERWH